MTVQIDYPLGLPGLTITATAWPASAPGAGPGVALTLTDPNSVGYYSESGLIVGGSGHLPAGLNWLEILAGGSPFDQGFVEVVDGQICRIYQADVDAVGVTVSLSGANITAIANGVVSQLGSAPIRLVSPLSSDGQTLTLTTGDSYTAANGQNFKFNIVNESALVGTVPHIRLAGQSIDLASAPAIISGTQQIVFNDVPASRTLLLTAGNARYQIRFEDGSGNVATEIQGQARIIQGL